ncbi:MAG: hypothetical protein Q9213_007367 [Squamulea squamosa]
MHILVTNDDGPPSNQSSPYIHSFVNTLQSAGHIVSVILPHQQRSWIGKAHFAAQVIKPTYFRPGRLHQDDGTTHAKPLQSDSDDQGHEEWVLVNSTPATATQLGLFHFFQERGPVDLVVSGPNYGRNTTSLFSLSSGTIGGAMEAAVCRKRAVALSYAFFSRVHDPDIIAGASRKSVKLLEHLMKHWDDGVDLYSINVPLIHGVEGKKVLYTYALQNYWQSGSCFTEVDAKDEEKDEDPEEKEKAIREQGSMDGGGERREMEKGHRHRHFTWTPKFSDVYQSVDESEPGNDGWAVKEGLVSSVTPLKANFMHVPGLQGELKLCVQQQWPPRSPHEALLSSPTGRSRYRRYQDRTSPSPSPLKQTSNSPRLNRLKNVVDNQILCLEDEDEDEDEETLQLRLQALEAKLKLKQLRQKKHNVVSNISNVENENHTKSEVPSKIAIKGKAEERAWIMLRKDPVPTNVAHPVQIPASPPRKNVAPDLPKSPGRVLLGIDKGRKGKNVSLQRPPVLKSNNQDSDDPFLEDALQHRSARQQSAPYSSSGPLQGSVSRPIGFSERMANIRKHDKERRERARELETRRSTGFGIFKEELDRLNAVADEEAKSQFACSERRSAIPSFSRDDVLGAIKNTNGVATHRSTNKNTHDKVVTRRKEFTNPNASPGFVEPSRPPAKASTISPPPPKAQLIQSSQRASTDDSLFEPFSSFNLSKRIIPHETLTKALSEKSILLLPDVLSTVKAPNYCFSDDLEADIVVIATIASKSNPLTHRDAQKITEKTTTKDNLKSSLTEAAESQANARGKYMAVTLTDLKWTLDLYLFTTAFTRFRKLTPGTVVAILNPSIMPPPPHNPNNNRFSLTLSSSDDTILEIGTSRDVGWCCSVKKDGKHCGTWIDKRHTSVCEFHVDTQLEKTRRGRMEVNGMSVPFAPGGKKGVRVGFWGQGKATINSRRMQGKDYEKYTGGSCGSNSMPQGKQYDRFNQTTFYVGGPAPTSGFGQSAATLLDGDALADRGGREERLRKRLAEREREREIARKLGEGGNGIGGEYLKIRHENPATSDGFSSTQAGIASQGSREAVDATALGLKGNKAVNAQLSPLKMKKRLASTLEDRAIKKTRFVTEGGIKEAGSESLGPIADKEAANEDDGLDIV